MIQDLLTVRLIVERVLDLGYVFLSADYQLMPPASGHDIVRDIQDLIAFLKDKEITGLERPFRVDLNRYAVSGCSSGGLCAYLAAINCNPKPRAVLSTYGMGGNFFVSNQSQEINKGIK